MDLKIKLGKRIKELREINNLSQEVLAEKLNINRNSLGLIERGDSFPKAENICNLIKIFKIDYKDLFTFSDTRDNKYDDIVMKLKMLDDKSLENVCDIVDALVKKS